MAANPLRLALAFVLASFALGVSPLGRTAAVVPAGGQLRPSATPQSDVPTAAPERPPTVVDRCVDQGADPTPTAYPYPDPFAD